MAVELLEGRSQPLAHFTVECGDAVAQSCDRLGQIGALALQVGDPRFELGGLGFGHQIDRTHAVAFADQAVQPGRGFGGIGGDFVLRNSRDFGQLLGCDTDPLADIAGEARHGFVCAIPQPLEPRQALASLAQYVIGQAGGFRGFAQLPFADGQRVGRSAAGLGSARDCAT